MTKKHIIIGAAAAGIGAAHKVRVLDPDAEIVVISDEVEDPYNKCLLADYLAEQKTAKQVQLTTVQALKEKNITPLFGKRVVTLDVGQKKITLCDNSCLTYDTLCIATGCSSRMLAVPGLAKQENVFTFYSLADITKLDTYLKATKPTRAVVAGAGLSGLECADTLAMRGIQVTVVEMNAQLLARQIDSDASVCIERHMKNNGVTFIPRCQVIAVNTSKDLVNKVYLTDGSVLQTDLLICAIGLTPNSALAQQAGIEVQDGSIVTNRFLQTSIPSVYAAGDVALVHAYQSDILVRSSTWPDAMLQGMIAAHGMVGIERSYPGVIPITSSAFFGVKFAACPVLVENAAVQEVVKKDRSSYQKLLFSEQHQLRGFVQVGPTLTFNQLKRAMLTGHKVTTPEELLF